VWPFLAPAFNRNHLAALKTYIDADGVCHQSSDYTCGPAAAVTALRQMGLPAAESQIALSAHTSAAIGTPPDLLCAALHRLYRTNALVCEYRHFNSLSELKLAGGLTLAVVKFGFMVDHYVAVMAIDNDSVTVGDPLSGKATCSHEEFKRQWRFCGIVLKNATPEPAHLSSP
jgi:ABC-type bacteriocin/lantibiotic exporter with double-glycine peptidase domain